MAEMSREDVIRRLNELKVDMYHADDYDTVTAAITILSQQEERQKWRPFETAPTNRTEILVYRPDAGVFTALYTPALAEDGEEDEDNYCWFTMAGEDLTGDLPTHWMPLPKGPDEA